MSAFKDSWHYAIKTFGDVVISYKKGGLFGRIEKGLVFGFLVLNFLFYKNFLSTHLYIL